MKKGKAMIKLAESQVRGLLAQPESGMGHQTVEVKSGEEPFRIAPLR